MQNVRRRPLSRRKCNYLRVYEIQNKSLLTVTTTPPFCATIPPVRSSSDTNYFMRQSGAHSLCSPLSSSAARKFTTSKALPFPVPSIVYNQASPPTACTNHRQPTGLLSCFMLFPDSPAPSACAFASGNSIIRPSFNREQRTVTQWKDAIGCKKTRRSNMSTIVDGAPLVGIWSCSSPKVGA